MKAKNLMILRENGINVPRFFVFEKTEDFTPVSSFLLYDNKTYAVRSSFLAEDSKNHSFAGQFDTLLNVEKKDVKESIQKVFKSINKENVKLYEKINNLSECNNGRVIVQEMVHPTISGVLFTANPLGFLNEMVITVGQGLGENIVNDTINTTTYYYHIDDKKYHFIQNENAPLLSDKQIDEIIETGTKIKSIFGYDCDIEFAIEDDKLYILQSRPITTINCNETIILDNSNIVESYPGISLPLTQDFVKSMYYGVFYNCIWRICKDEKVMKQLNQYLENMVDVYNWRIYYRISNWYAVLKLLPFSNKIIPMWQKMMGVDNENVSYPLIEVSAKTKRKIVKSFF